MQSLSKRLDAHKKKKKNPNGNKCGSLISERSNLNLLHTCHCEPKHEQKCDKKQNKAIVYTEEIALSKDMVLVVLLLVSRP